jgi:hypothetical protein
MQFKFANCNRVLKHCYFSGHYSWTGIWIGINAKKWEMIPTAIFSFPYKRGLLPHCFLGFLSFICTTIVYLHKLSSSLFPHMILAYFLRALEEKILIYNHHQSIPPLSEGSPLNQDLGVIGWPPPLFFLSNSSKEFVALVGFGREGFKHISWCSCFASLHSIDLSIPIFLSERPWACYFWRVTS